MRFQFRLGIMLAAMTFLALLLGGGVLAYRRLTRPPAEILDFIRQYPDQPKPELVGWGISPPFAFLLLAVLAAAITAVVVVAWRFRVAR